MVGRDKMRISWMTRKPALSKVEYGMSSGVYDTSVIGTSTTYYYLLYKSGHIHEVVIGPLNPNTVYYYSCSADASREFFFKTTPPQLPINFVVIGTFLLLSFVYVKLSWNFHYLHSFVYMTFTNRWFRADRMDRFNTTTHITSQLRHALTPRWLIIRRLLATEMGLIWASSGTLG